jgi:hypothetical protein
MESVDPAIRGRPWPHGSALVRARSDFRRLRYPGSVSRYLGRLVLGALLAVACHHGPANEPVIEQAKRYFGANRSVSPSGIVVPNAEIFIAVPDPIPADYDGYDAVLVPVSGGPLRSDAALRFVWQSGVRDPELLARVAAVFVGNSRQVAHAGDRNTTVIRGHDHLEDPVLTGQRLVFCVVRGSMAPEAYEVTVDLGTFKTDAHSIQ